MAGEEGKKKSVVSKYLRNCIYLIAIDMNNLCFILICMFQASGLLERWVSVLSERDQAWVTQEMFSKQRELNKSQSLWVYPELKKPYLPHLPGAGTSLL